MEKEACFILGLLAIKQEHQHAIADTGALPGLVAILKRYVPFRGPPNTGASVVRRAADAITNLAHENVVIKSKVRAEEGIPPLVALLDAYDAKVETELPMNVGIASQPELEPLRGLWTNSAWSTLAQAFSFAL